MMTKLLAFSCALLYSMTSFGHTVFEGYASYFQALPDRVFKLESASSFEGATARTILWKGHQFKKKRAVTFPGETATELDLGSTPVVYRQPG